MYQVFLIDDDFDDQKFFGWLFPGCRFQFVANLPMVLWKLLKC